MENKENQTPQPGFPIADRAQADENFTAQPSYEGAAGEFNPGPARPRNPAQELGPAELRGFFISHLNRIYCAKTQLADKLPLLASRANFLDLQQAVDETVLAVRLQIQRMNQIYIRLGSFYQPESCVGLAGILDEAFQSIGVPGEGASLRDLSILFYMENIESIETASFQIMMRVADRLQQPEIAQLLLECYDEARDDKALFRAITANYL